MLYCDPEVLMLQNTEKYGTSEIPSCYTFDTVTIPESGTVYPANDLLHEKELTGKVIFTYTCRS